MARLKSAWDKLSMNEKALFIRLGLLHGLSDLKDIRDTYNLYSNGGLEEILNKVNSSNTNFVQRLKDPNRKNIPDWESPTDRISTHKLSVGTDENGNHYIFPEVQEINGELIDFTRPPYHRFAGEISAEMRGDTVRVPSLEDAIKFTETYKQYYPFNNGGNLAHKKSGEELGETQYLKLDDAANYKAYEDATNYFLNLGFSPKLASEYAIDKVHNNMTFDAGMLPEINVIAQAWGDGDNTSRMENYLKARLNVREAATLAQQIDFNLNIRNATDKWGKGIGLGMTALAALPVASGAMAGMNALRASYPIATGLWDAYWAGDGIVRNLFGDSGVKKTYNLIKEGDTWGALKSGAGDALDLLGVADLFSLGKKILTPTYRAAHAYHTIRPWNYDDPFNRGKLFVTSMLTGLEPNVNINPQWFIEHLKYGALSALHELYGRDEAWRMYLGLPTRRGYYIPNKDGSFSYNLQKIMKDVKINNKWNVMGLGLDATDVLLATGHKGRDVITGAAGYLGQNDLLYKHVIPNQNIELSIRRIGDDWDLHPFRKQNSLSSSINKSIMTTANRMYSSIYDKLQKTHDVLFGQHHSSNTPLRIWYDYLGGKQLRNLRFEGLSDAVAANIDKLNFLQNFEMGPILGGKPFKMITDVPMTKNLSPTDVFDIYTIGFPNNVQLPTDITNWQLQALPEVQVTFPTSNLHSTGGPLYPFSFEKNPFLKTPVVRYDEGGKKLDASNPGGYTDEQLNKNYLIWKTYDPTGGLNFINYLMSLGFGNLARGEENEYWKEYLGLNSAVPLMNYNAHTEWDKQIEALKKQNGELASDFYGTTPRMDYNIQALADTLMLGNMVRNYEEYNKTYNLPHIETVTEAYEQAKNILNNPNKWTLVDGEIPIGLYKYDPETSETNPLGMLANFGMKWVPEENALYMHDTYDFPSRVHKKTEIPVRPREMKIRSKINFDPTKGSWLLRSPVNYNTEIPAQVIK